MNDLAQFAAPILLAIAFGAAATDPAASSSACRDVSSPRKVATTPGTAITITPPMAGPVALVVPPTAGMQSRLALGVGGTRISPIYHQFGRGYPGRRLFWRPAIPADAWLAEATLPNLASIPSADHGEPPPSKGHTAAAPWCPRTNARHDHCGIVRAPPAPQSFPRRIAHGPAE